ncbi:hypothetical protein VFPBJ_11768 [Purpureocillium lilacinum]|uniref:Uncharacterized protein n=1 Tax=Purpureocillium lilacinum TaxID=33203 RepID=A0A179EVR4_PURLI|nr:hypothetical protein VFPBJ_11768 [Purpureocillium lilacinum]
MQTTVVSGNGVGTIRDPPVLVVCSGADIMHHGCILQLFHERSNHETRWNEPVQSLSGEVTSRHHTIQANLSSPVRCAGQVTTRVTRSTRVSDRGQRVAPPSEVLRSFQRRLEVSYLDRVIHLPRALYTVVQPLKRVMARPEQTKLEWRRGFPGFQSSLEVLSRENAARGRNQQIVLENGVRVERGQSLNPLLSLSTGEVIVSFPSSVDEVNHLPSSEVNRILIELGLYTDGNVRQRRRRLLTACGVRQ